MSTRERRTSGRSALPKTIAHRSVLVSSASSKIFVLSAYASPLPADVSGATVVENSLSELSEIVVTSQRRAENLQTLPLSVTAATASELLNEGVTDTASLSLAVPGLSYTLGGNSAEPFIRGVGTTIVSVGNEASVATYVDDVYISSINAQLFELANIDRIEVMKGPQGTLFGRNATGGVNQVITRAPSFTLSLTGNHYCAYEKGQ